MLIFMYELHMRAKGEMQEMENVVSIRLEDFLEIRDRVLELEQELDSAYNEVQELNDKVLEVKGKNFELKKHVVSSIGTYGYARTAEFSDFVNIDTFYSSSLKTLYKLGFTDIELISFLELMWRENQKSEEEQEC